MDARLEALRNWVSSNSTQSVLSIEPVAADASFRRYFRVKFEGAPARILMDAPPEHETPAETIRLASRLRQLGAPVPEVIVADPELGAALLEDFGDLTLLQVLNDETADQYYREALKLLVDWQSIDPKLIDVPDYNDALLRRDCLLFQDWYLCTHLGLKLSSAEQQMLNNVFAELVARALMQPTVLTHRDFHAGNLMVRGDDTLGVIDFQDAVSGPVTYDVVSLLRDSRIAWPPSHVDQWLTFYFHMATERGVIQDIDFSTFSMWFDWMGLQLHLKILGIFARLNYRDEKTTYMQHIPRLFDYVDQMCQCYAELNDFSDFLNNKVSIK